jgi:hypothetical protein
MIRANDRVEVDIEALPNVMQEPCSYCVPEDIIELQHRLTKQYQAENPDETLTVGDLYESSFVRLSILAEQAQRAHLSNDCPEIAQIDKCKQQKVHRVDDDRQICMSCRKAYAQKASPGIISARFKEIETREGLVQSD